MSTFTGKILVSGASGQLGQLVVEALLKQVPASQVVATARNPQALAAFAARGVEVRQADYTRPESLLAALQGIDRALLISSSEVGRRISQHRNFIDAAKQAGVKLLAYTSLLHADTSPLLLGEEHRTTEALLAAAGVPYVLLRNGWYTENCTGSVDSALQHGTVLGSAGDGRLSTASRADYAAAAAAVLVAPESLAGQVYELAGDDSFTLADYAAEITRQSGKPVVYNNLPEAGYRAVLVQAGLPEGLATIVAQSDAAAAQGGLFDDSHQLSRLIGRPTTPWRDTLATALAKRG